MDNGTYRGKASVWSLGFTSTGKEQLTVIFDLLDLPGQRINWYGYFTEAAIDGAIKALRTMGWQGTDLANIQGLDAGEVELVIENETYEGKTSPRVRWVNAPGGAAMRQAMDPQAAASFAARMRGRVLAADKAAARTVSIQPVTRPAAQHKPAPSAGSAGDLDIPF